MKKQPHFNPKSKNWIISLIIMIIVSLAVIFGADALYKSVNAEPAQSSLAVVSVAAPNIG